MIYSYEIIFHYNKDIGFNQPTKFVPLPIVVMTLFVVVFGCVSVVLGLPTVDDVVV